MAEQDKESRTEDATPKKKEKLRREGNFPKSPDVSAAAVLFAALGALAVFASQASQQAQAFAERCFRLEDRPLEAFEGVLPTVIYSLLPILIASFVAAGVAGVVQTRGLFNLELLKIKPERLNPLPKMKSIFPTKTTLVEIGKQLLKILILGAVVVQLILASSGDIGVLTFVSPVVGANLVAGVVTRVFLYGGMAFAALAVLDFYVAIRRHAEESKMSKQDLKDEHHSQEGRPEVKAQRRRRAREVAKQRAVADVQQASVLVCNPTHVAIALRYQAEETPAPIVLAKGVDDTALEMRAEARKHGIPMVENRPLARTLLKTAKLGEAIPVDLYKAVAEVIAHVMRIR